MTEARPARQDFRVLTRHRSGAGGVEVVDVQLQLVSSGELVWSQSFSDPGQAEQFHAELEQDLDGLLATAFRRKYGVPASA